MVIIPVISSNYPLKAENFSHFCINWTWSTPKAIANEESYLRILVGEEK